MLEVSDEAMAPAVLDLVVMGWIVMMRDVENQQVTNAVSVGNATVAAGSS